MKRRFGSVGSEYARFAGRDGIIGPFPNAGNVVPSSSHNAVITHPQPFVVGNDGRSSDVPLDRCRFAEPNGQQGRFEGRCEVDEHIIPVTAIPYAR